MRALLVNAPTRSRSYVLSCIVGLRYQLEWNLVQLFRPSRVDYVLHCLGLNAVQCLYYCFAYNYRGDPPHIGHDLYCLVLHGFGLSRQDVVD
jgi:hypothetical protein